MMNAYFIIILDGLNIFFMVLGIIGTFILFLGRKPDDMEKEKYGKLMAKIIIFTIFCFIAVILIPPKEFLETIHNKKLDENYSVNKELGGGLK